MRTCSGIRADGGRCQAQAIRDSEYCINHDPTRVEENRKRGSKGGRRGGRGRASSELKRLQARFEELADQVLAGEIERGSAAIAGQLLGGARACIRDGMAAKEQEELIERLEALEQALERDREGYAS